MCFVSQISWLINLLCTILRPQLLLNMCTIHMYCFALISCIPFFHLNVPWVLGCCSLRRPDAELHQAIENAFVTLNPCRVSVDDIIVWEHITSPLSRLSLKDSTTLCLLSYTHTCTLAERPAHLFTSVISISTCIFIIAYTYQHFFLRGLMISYCIDANYIMGCIQRYGNFHRCVKSWQLNTITLILNIFCHHWKKVTHSKCTTVQKVNKRWFLSTELTH